MSSIVSHLPRVGTKAAAGSSAGLEGRSGNVTPLRPSHADYACMLRAIAAGDRKAEDTLMRALATPLEVVLSHRARGVEGVDDLRQEALMRILQAARNGELDDPQALVQYALVTARRLALNAQRKSNRCRTVSDDGVIASVVDPAAVPADDLADRGELRGCVDVVMAEMRNPRDRQLLYGYYLDECSSEQLQAQYALSGPQFGRVLHRARQRFAELWQAFRFEAPGA